MFRQTLLFLFAIGLSFTGFSQTYRTIDGTLNNLQNPSWGAAQAPLDNMTSVAFEDGFSTPAGSNRANPRIISNELFAQSGLKNDPLGLSDFLWVFGQFLDHDVISVANDATEDISIPVNFPDNSFNPGGIFQNINIHMNRSEAMEGTGTSVNNPRKYANSITAWIDGSNVYGSDETRANWLRSFTDGKLKTSAGNLLPYNTLTGEIDGEIDPNAPFMDNENPFNDKLFIAGDSRANEQPLLAAFHTIFVREHNRLCDELIIAHPDWTDEQLYSHARHLVSGFLQAITYQEWLPAMGVHLPAYTGYNETSFPNISNVFSAAAFRLGHTLLNSNIQVLDSDGSSLATLTLKDAFFNPLLLNDYGLDPFFKGMATQIEQDLDGKVIDDVRNFLFGPPQFGLGGLDLAAININRGRERGLADFNTIRTDLGLSAYTSFSEVCSDSEVYGELQDLYNNDVNNIDPWVGMLVENHMQDALFGETIMEIMVRQFSVLRDGDRFYFENDPNLSTEEVETIQNTTFRDIIMRNTSISLMQSNVFLAMPHDSICPTAVDWVDMTGNIQTETGLNVDEVVVQLSDVTEATLDDYTTDTEGNFIFNDLTTCEHYIVRPFYNEDIRNGVNTNDMVKMAKHILSTEVLDSPYKIIAADVNNNGSVNIADLLHLQKVILFIDSSFINTTPWRFVDANYVFQNPGNPLAENFAEEVDITYLSEQSAQQNFVAVKIGDLNLDVDPANLQAGETRQDDPLIFYTKDQLLEQGEEYTVDFSTKTLADVTAYQYTLDYNPTALELVDIEPGDLDNMSQRNFGLLQQHGAITTNWYGEVAEGAHQVFSLTFRAKVDGRLSEQLSLGSRFTPSAAFDQNSEVKEVALQYETESASNTSPAVFALYQNQPNPFGNQTTVGFHLPEAGKATLSIFDISGRTIQVIEDQYSQGYQEIQLSRTDLPATGLLYYQLNAASGSITKKMLLK